MTIERFAWRVDGGGYEHMFLSNFYEEPFVCGLLGEVRTAEHAYHAFKCASTYDRPAILAESTPAGAKRAGRSVALRVDWEAVKIPTMRAVLSSKFAEGSNLAWRLLDTRDEKLVEGNDWGDRFWGVDGVGANWLGYLLMARRAELRAS